MKRVASLILAFVFLASMSACACAQSYTASTKGYAGDVTVTITIEDGKLSDVLAEGPSETTGIGSRAIEQMPAAMLAKNSVEVDGVSGASYTSQAVLTAAAQALAESGATLVPVEAEAALAIDDVQTDVVIVGAGIAGMTAAMRLADQGIDVVLVEKTDVVGGAAVISHGGIWAIDCKATAEVYDFTVDEIYEFFNKQAGPVYNHDAFFAVAKMTTDGYEFLTENGVPFNGIGPCNAQADNRFWGLSCENFGAGMMAALNAALDQRRIDVRTNTTVTELVLDENGAVTGVVAECDGVRYTISAAKTILATGGFGRNNEMLAEYTTGADKLADNYTFAGSTGDGHVLGLAVGAQLVGFGSMGFTTMPQDMDGVEFGKPLAVDITGAQVASADEHYTKLYQIINAQDNNEIYIIFPSNMNDYNGTNNSVEVMEARFAEGGLYKADTIAELAEQIGIDPNALVATVEAHNEQCAKGITDKFNTPLDMMYPIEQGPFYADARKACIIGTITGLAVDEQMEVLDADDKPIANLYAIGELTYGNYFNGTYPMSGTGLGLCVASGSLAAQAVGQALK